MALKALLLRKKLDAARAALEELRAKDQELQTREAELEAAIGEAVTEEDKQAVEGLVSEFEAEKKEHEEKKTGLTGQVEQFLLRFPLGNRVRQILPRPQRGKERMKKL